MAATIQEQDGRYGTGIGRTHVALRVRRLPGSRHARPTADGLCVLFFCFLEDLLAPLLKTALKSYKLQSLSSLLHSVLFPRRLTHSAGPLQKQEALEAFLAIKVQSFF